MAMDNINCCSNGTVTAGQDNNYNGNVDGDDDEETQVESLLQDEINEEELDDNFDDVDYDDDDGIETAIVSSSRSSNNRRNNNSSRGRIGRGMVRNNDDRILLLNSREFHQTIFDKYKGDDDELFDFDGYMNELSSLAEEKGIELPSSSSRFSRFWTYTSSFFSSSSWSPCSLLSSSCQHIKGGMLMMMATSRKNTLMTRKRRFICFGVFIVIIISILITIPLSIKHKRQKKLQQQSHKSPSGDAASDNISHDATTYSRSTLQSSFPPFSLLDPVNDLNVYNYKKRPNHSKPSSSRLDPLKYFLQLVKEKSTTNLSEGSASASAASSAKSDVVIALPTNSWYQPMIPRGGEDNQDDQQPTKEQRVYTIPYMIDAASSSIPGLRIHQPRIIPSGTQVTTTIDEPYALIVGLTTPTNGGNNNGQHDQILDNMKLYNVVACTDLGITLQWTTTATHNSGGENSDNNNNYSIDDVAMESSLVRGMPYVTMIYTNNNNNNNGNSNNGASRIPLWPTILSQVDLSGPVVVDNNKSIQCENEPEFNIQKEIKMEFASGQTWFVFFSQPVQVACQIGGGGSGGTDTPPPFMIQVIDTMNVNNNNGDDSGSDNNNTNPLIVRVASLLESTSSDDQGDEEEDYVNLLRHHANVYPGKLTNVQQSIEKTTTTAAWIDGNGIGSDKNTAYIEFDWNSQSMVSSSSTEAEEEKEMIMFALPHHQDIIMATTTKSSTNGLDGRTNNSDGGIIIKKEYCTTSMLGPICIFKGNTWTMKEDLPEVSFQAPRHPDPTYILNIAESLQEDIYYRIADNYLIGAGDTYFSGKALAKLARILIIFDELNDLCYGGHHGDDDGRYESICKDVTLPSYDEYSNALNHLRTATEIWLHGNGQAPFVYDASWGGIVSCGCNYDNGQCLNKFPTDECPAFTDQGLNFGNAYYNDHHFHYGYHVYAAAVMSHFDPDWGMENFENVLLLVRDYANPSVQDNHFTTFRNKDWYRGHSWASGITDPVFPNGLNQESSSEAIAAYEAMALFGKTMKPSYQANGDTEKSAIADTIHSVGLILTATEIRSTQKYWQVTAGEEGSERVYPEAYEPYVVGILWSTMVQFTTWFGNNPYLIYGIQLLPLTPISEYRDNVEWCKLIYNILSQSCNQACVSEGWSVQVIAILATIGHKDLAVEHAKQLSPSSFTSAGGSGHSRTNTLWYIATRPEIDNPYPAEDIQQIEIVELTCDQPASCTNSVLDTMAGGYTCRHRMEFLMNSQGMTQVAACNKVANAEYPMECGSCDPNGGGRFREIF